MSDKIDKLREKYRAVEEPTEERRVVTLDRRVYEAPEGTAPFDPADKKDREIDTDALETLQMAMDMVKSGDVRGAVVVLGLKLTDDPNVVSDVTSLMSLNVTEDLLLFVGGLEAAKHDAFGLYEDMFDDDED